MTIAVVGFELFLDARKAVDDFRGREGLKVLGRRPQLTAGYERKVLKSSVLVITHLGAETGAIAALGIRGRVDVGAGGADAARRAVNGLPGAQLALDKLDLRVESVSE